MIIHTCEQGSAKWLQLRTGKITASRFKDVVSKGKTRQSYMYEIVAERLTGDSAHTFVSDAMKWGIEKEPEAREYYELVTGNSVKQVGFVEASEYVGVSPDGLIGDDGVLEIKCPNTKTHLSYIDNGVVPTEYFWQCVGMLAYTGMEYLDFVSYDPRLPGEWKIFKTKLLKTDVRNEIKKLHNAVDQLNNDVNTFIKEMKR